jgi:hypothetical protein
MQRIWLAAFIVIQNLLGIGHAEASDISVTDTQVSYEFGKQITFFAELEANLNIEEAYLFIQSEGQATRLEKIAIDNNNRINYRCDVESFPLRSFAPTAYWFQFELQDGSVFESEKYYFDYVDNRFDWKQLGNDRFEIYWYAGDLAFGQQILDVAESSLAAAGSLVRSQAPMPIQIYVYLNSKDLQSGLQLSNQEWVAGHACIDLATILISVSPGPEQQLELERQLPHEITHILQFQIMQDNYRQLPVWFAEGMASITEFYPNSDYQRVLGEAVSTDMLMPITSLCETFPHDASRAFLAYAEATSFTDFLHKRYGTSKLNELMLNYHDGLGCDEAILSTFNQSIDQLERDWKQDSLGIEKEAMLFKNLAPYIIILSGLLIPGLLGTVYVARKRKDKRTQ